MNTHDTQPVPVGTAAPLVLPAAPPALAAVPAPAPDGVPADVAGTVVHRSRATGIRWEAVNSLYYDCHVVSVAQLLPPRLLAAFLLVAGVPTIRVGWGGLYCRNQLDSEAARDVVLLDNFGVDKHLLPIDREIEGTIRNAVHEFGHCIVRVDSYYHEHFKEYFQREHRTNGHKVTVIDFDDTGYTGIDNVGVHTLVLRFERQLFVEAVRSNLYHVYEKHDTLYRLEVGDRARDRMAQGAVLAHELAAVAAFRADRAVLPDHLAAYREAVAGDLTRGGVRRYAQLANSYTTALTIERAYLALLEAHQRTTEPWSALPDQGMALMAKLAEAMKSWRMFKMLCRTEQSGRQVSDGALLSALSRVLVAEEATVQAGGRA
jgi:hypothetical protein